jgi:hypothetical protein
MTIDFAFYPHILDLILDALYADRDVSTLRTLGLASSALHAVVQRKLLQHVVVRRVLDTGSDDDTERSFVWDARPTKARVLDVHDEVFRTESFDEPPILGSFSLASEPNTVRFFSRMHHRFKLPGTGVQTAIFNVDIPDSAFATVYPEDDLVVACPLPEIPVNILHLRYDQRGMGDFGFAFEALPASSFPDGVRPDEPKPDHREHEVCVLAKMYDYGPRPKSPWRSTLLNQLATSSLAYLHAFPRATLTLVGMDAWDTWCGSPFPDEEWEPTPPRYFANKAEKVRYFWDWMFEIEFGRRYADIEDIKARVRFETEVDFRERIGSELATLVFEPPKV